MIDEGCSYLNSDCSRCSVKSALFCHLTDEELKQVDRNKLTVLFRKGETIRKQGTQMSHVISLNSGYAKVFIEGPAFRNSIIRVVGSTNFIGGPGIHYDRMHHYTVTALSDTTVCLIELDMFRSLLRTNQMFHDAYMKEYSRQVLAIFNRLLFLTQKHMHGRMADSLLYLSDEVFRSSSFPVYLSKQDMADLSGMSKESAIKILREFMKSGLLSMNGRLIEITGAEGLKRISRTG